MTPTKIYSLLIPAGGSFQLQAVGDYFKLVSASADVEVRGDTFGTIGVIKAGQGLRRTPFQRLEFKEVSGFQNSIQVLVGGSDFVDERIAGSVEVIDGGRNRTLAGSAFFAEVSVAASAAMYSVAQLFNPVGSGGNLVVNRLNLASGAGGAFGVGWHAGAVLAPLGGTASKRVSGGFVSVAQTRGGTTAAIGAVGQWFTMQMPANGFVPYKMEEPIVLPPGTGLSVWSGAVNVDLRASVEYWEDVA